MKVVTFETMDGRTRYYLAGENEIPVEPVLDYLRFEDNRGLARNTLRLQCIQLKHFYSLWKIEESFRIMKSDFDARPIYVNTELISGLIMYQSTYELPAGRDMNDLLKRIQEAYEERAVSSSTSTALP